MANTAYERLSNAIVKQENIANNWNEFIVNVMKDPEHVKSPLVIHNLTITKQRTEAHARSVDIMRKKYKRVKADQYTVEFQLEIDKTKAHLIKFFDASKKWKPGFRRSVLNTLKERFFRGAPLRNFKMRMLVECELEELVYRPETFAPAADFKICFIFCFDKADDAVLYRLWLGAEA